MLLLASTALVAPLQKPASAQEWQTPTPTKTATAVPPIIPILGEDVILQYRIENSWKCGGTAHDCMWNESDAMVITRIAMGEAPNSFGDRVYVMWNIKLRAALGFKEAGYYSGHRSLPDRWGPETSIKTEALCDRGCQYSPARSAANIYFACELDSRHPLRPMLCPTDEQLIQFNMTYLVAQDILDSHIGEMPTELWGYDSFRSPTITWMGTRNREGGLLSQRFFSDGNIWRDEYDKDNVFWEAGGQMASETPTPPRPTPRPKDTPVPTDIPIEHFPEELTKSKEEKSMLGEPWDTLIFLVFVPLIVQGIRVWRDKAGKEPPRWAVQLIGFILSGVFIFLSGGFFGLDLPLTCDFVADLVGCVGAWLSAAVAAYALVLATYEVVWKAIYEKAGFSVKRNLI